MNAAQRVPRLAYHYESLEASRFLEQSRAPARCLPSYRNPIALAQEWNGMLASGECARRADLARKLGVSRARVTQVLALLDLAPAVLDAIVALGGPQPRLIANERMLRPLLKLPPGEQLEALRSLVVTATRMHPSKRTA